MAGAAALGGSADGDFVDVEAGGAKPLGKCRMRARRPDREHAARPQRAADRCQSRQIVQRIIGLADQPLRAVVDIEQDGVERRGARCDHLDDVSAQNAGARIVEAVAEDFRHRPPRPGDHGGHQFRHRDPRLRPQHRERGAQRKAHAQPADQQMRRLDGFQSSTGQRRQRLLRSREAAAHQLVLAEFHGKLGAALHQAQFDVRAGHACRIDLFPRNHPKAFTPLWRHRAKPVMDRSDRCRGSGRARARRAWWPGPRWTLDLRFH